MKNTLIAGLTAVVFLIANPVKVLAATYRSCEDQQVYLAVMESARRDLPAPYSEMDVKGSIKTTTLTQGQCRMTLFLVGGEEGQKEVDVLYKTTVPLSQIRVQLAESDQDQDEMQCKPIKFQRGHVSATVTGSVAPEQQQCYSVATGANQTMEVSVISTNKNIAITIPEIGDARDRFEFLTKKKTYQILVFQLMRAADKDSYSLTVTIR